MTALRVLWINLRDVYPHRFHTDIPHIYHRAKRATGYHKDDTVTSPGHNFGDSCSNEISMRKNLKKDFLFLEFYLYMSSRILSSKITFDFVKQ